MRKYRISSVESAVTCRFGRCSNNAAPVSRMPNFVDKNRALSNSANNFRAQPSIYDQGSSGGYNFMQAAQGRSGPSRYSNPSFSSSQSRMGAQQQSYGGYGNYGNNNQMQNNQMSYGMPQISYPKSTSNFPTAPKLPVYPGSESSKSASGSTSPIGTLMKAIATTSTTTTTTTTQAPALDINAQHYPDSSTGSDFQDQMMQYMQAMQQYMQFYNPQMFEQQQQANHASNSMALSKPSSGGSQYGMNQRVGSASGPTNIQQIRFLN